MLNRVERFLKIKLEDDYFTLRLMTLMDVLIPLGKVVLYCSCSDEAVLVGMNKTQDDSLQPFSKDLGDHPQRNIHQ